MPHEDQPSLQRPRYGSIVDDERLSAEEMDERRRQNIAYEYLCHLEEAKSRSAHILVGIEWKIHLKRQLTEMASFKRSCGNIRTMPSCDCTPAHHKCMPRASILSEEALTSCALFSSRKPMPVRYACLGEH
ncbi:hypothetical protein E5288_WYG004487 [Bos mutus]|uniref:Uncharacterized protein n=1 Tax=Bos mutus TaxID=72004 RepID=A0A6B0RSW1_9CETA|nr:hypothetical protein [Bos mutus]